MLEDRYISEAIDKIVQNTDLNDPSPSEKKECPNTDREPPQTEEVSAKQGTNAVAKSASDVSLSSVSSQGQLDSRALNKSNSLSSISSEEDPNLKAPNKSNGSLSSVSSVEDVIPMAVVAPVTSPKNWPYTETRQTYQDYYDYVSLSSSESGFSEKVDNDVYNPKRSSQHFDDALAPKRGKILASECSAAEREAAAKKLEKKMRRVTFRLPEEELEEAEDLLLTVNECNEAAEKFFETDAEEVIEACLHINCFKGEDIYEALGNEISIMETHVAEMLEACGYSIETLLPEQVNSVAQHFIEYICKSPEEQTPEASVSPPAKDPQRAVKSSSSPISPAKDSQNETSKTAATPSRLPSLISDNYELEDMVMSETECEKSESEDDDCVFVTTYHLVD